MIDWDNWNTKNGQMYFDVLKWFFNNEINWKEVDEEKNTSTNYI